MEEKAWGQSAKPTPTAHQTNAVFSPQVSALRVTWDVLVMLTAPVLGSVNWPQHMLLVFAPKHVTLEPPALEHLNAFNQARKTPGVKAHAPDSTIRMPAKSILVRPAFSETRLAIQLEAEHTLASFKKPAALEPNVTLTAIVVLEPVLVCLEAHVLRLAAMPYFVLFRLSVWSTDLRQNV
jgi:hypothetical protein